MDSSGHAAEINGHPWYGARPDQPGTAETQSGRSTIYLEVKSISPQIENPEAFVSVEVTDEQRLILPPKKIFAGWPVERLSVVKDSIVKIEVYAERLGTSGRDILACTSFRVEDEIDLQEYREWDVTLRFPEADSHNQIVLRVGRYPSGSIPRLQV
ncbi:hypothetical protein AOQ84DRAFT_372841 [Glonium stellatum]|uniref:Uncharacterized protein n=1 Tax=Glonium stellatum TaxID=574774 RepID=A0A8E2F9C1_9PEZI|nr:hypothetical protein AOQ84DRAFT_372841 [Glonium stellatum]